MSDEPEQGPTPLPEHMHVVSVLEKRGLLMYGQVIKWAVIEPLMGLGAKSDFNWRFLGEQILMFKELQRRGFLCTEKDQRKEGFRIMTREEMADEVRVRETRKAKDSLDKSFMLSAVPHEGLSTKEVAKIEHMAAKCALIGASSMAFIRKRTLPPIATPRQPLANTADAPPPESEE